MKQWSYLTLNVECGPVSPGELRRLYNTGAIDLETLVWTEGMSAWEPLSEHSHVVKNHIAAIDKNKKEIPDQSVHVKEGASRPEPKAEPKKAEHFSNDSRPSSGMKGNHASVARGWIVAFVVLAMLGMLFFPPFQITFQGTIHNMGYGYLFSPPTVRGITASIAVPILLVQILVILVLAAASWFYSGHASQADGNSQENNDNASLFQRLILPLLRAFRALIGLVFLWQLLGLLPVFTWISDPSAVSPDMMAAVTLKGIVALISGFAFAKLGRVINSLYSAWLGEDYPRLEKFFSL